MFERFIKLTGQEKFDLLQTKKVLLIGCGGVGGYTFFSLIRSGIQNITVIDYDIIDITNLNRQIISNQHNIGKLKIDEIKCQGLEINPNLNIQTINLKLTNENLPDLSDYDYIIDACDTISVKTELIKKCQKEKIKLISCLGTANKFNPDSLKIISLDKTSYDPIAKVLRKELKDFNQKKIVVVSSNEKPLKVSGLGSTSFVPAVAGMLCASYVINDILR